MDPTLYFVILFVVGLVTGFINTIAGGGSLITLPVLMLLGMPAQIANATNRVGIFFSALAGLYGFHKKGHLPKENVLLIILPTIFGGIVGAFVASYTPSHILKYVLVVCMFLVSFTMLFNSKTMDQNTGNVTKADLKKPKNLLYLFGSGFYGGFIQAGVGFILLATFCIAMNFDLLKGNAFKILAAFSFTLFSLLIFMWRSQVEYVPGLILAFGAVIGSFCAVKFAIAIPKMMLKRIIVVIVVLACIGVIIK